MLLDGTEDVIIAAATARGKTEAAFLPICSPARRSPTPRPGVQVLYVGPLKALINDQYRPPRRRCASASTSRCTAGTATSPPRRRPRVLKQARRASCSSPRSRSRRCSSPRGAESAGCFAGLQYVVVDELHAFLGTERGAQLRSPAAPRGAVDSAPGSRGSGCPPPSAT